MKRIVILLVLLGAFGAVAGTLTFDDGRSVQAEVIKIGNGELVYQDVNKKLVTVPLAKVKAYTKENMPELITDDPEEYADYTIANIDLKMPISSIGELTSTSKQQADIKFTVNRKRDPKAKKLSPKIRHPYVVIYVASEKKVKQTTTTSLKDGNITKPKEEAKTEYSRFTYPKSFRPKDFAHDDTDRIKTLRDQKRETVDFEKMGKDNLGTLKSTNEMELEISLSSKLKESKIKAYRVEIWGLDAEKPLYEKDWNTVGFTPEVKWWYNAKR